MYRAYRKSVTRDDRGPKNRKNVTQKPEKCDPKRKGPPNVKRTKTISLVSEIPTNIHAMPNLPDPLPVVHTYVIYIFKVLPQECVRLL